MECSRRVDKLVQAHRHILVSILVFMECSRRDFNGRLICERCFLFQSLFLWNALVEGAAAKALLNVVLFQSLFLWNALVEGYALSLYYACL